MCPSRYVTPVNPPSFRTLPAIHARGPCGIKELTSYKYVVYGEGQVRQ